MDKEKTAASLRQYLPIAEQPALSASFDVLKFNVLFIETGPVYDQRAVSGFGERAVATMRVSGTGRSEAPKVVRGAGKSGKTGGASFARQLDAASGVETLEAAPLLDGVSPATGIDALLAAQAVEEVDDQGRRRTMVDYGESLLDRLQSIQRALILGDLTRERLESLSRSLRGREQGDFDPKLSSILEEIELRVEVELAKYTVSRNG